MIERFKQLAQRDRDKADSLDRVSAFGTRFPSVLDMIEAQIYRIRASAYVALGNGESPDDILREFGEYAKIAARSYNETQQKNYVKTWQPGITGYLSEEEAYMRIHAAYRMAKTQTER